MVWHRVRLRSKSDDANFPSQNYFREQKWLFGAQACHQESCRRNSSPKYHLNILFSNQNWPPMWFEIKKRGWKCLFTSVANAHYLCSSYRLRLESAWPWCSGTVHNAVTFGGISYLASQYSVCHEILGLGYRHWPVKLLRVCFRHVVNKMLHRKLKKKKMYTGWSKDRKKSLRMTLFHVYFICAKSPSHCKNKQ